MTDPWRELDDMDEWDFFEQELDEFVDCDRLFKKELSHDNPAIEIGK